MFAFFLFRINLFFSFVQSFALQVLSSVFLIICLRIFLPVSITLTDCKLTLPVYITRLFFSLAFALILGQLLHFVPRRDGLAVGLFSPHFFDMAQHPSSSFSRPLIVRLIQG